MLSFSCGLDLRTICAGPCLASIFLVVSAACLLARRFSELACKWFQVRLLTISLMVSDTLVVLQARTL